MSYQPVNDFSFKLKEPIKEKNNFIYGSIFMDDILPSSNFENLKNISKYKNILL